MGIQERRERERESRRQAVLGAARALLRERGFNGTTTKQIAERCELSEATLFWYFNSKDEIFTSLLFEGIDFMAKGLERIIAADLTSEQKLSHLWEFFAEVREEHPEYFQIFAYLAHPQSTAAVTNEVRDEIARRSGHNFRLFAHLIGDTIGTEPPRLIADLLWGAFVGLMVLKDSRANLDAKPHPTPQELSAAFKLLMDGIASKTTEGRGR